MNTESTEVQELFDRISTCLPKAVKLNAAAFRSVAVKYANQKDIISGHGSSYHGGRWNPPEVRAIYASLDPITAVKESYQEFDKFGFKDQYIKPRVIAGIKLKVKRLFDLTDGRIRRIIGFSLNDLMQEDWHTIQIGGEESWTQVIGRGAKLAGFEGLLTISVSHRPGKNIVIFPDNLDPTGIVELMSEEELPPHPSDWPK